MTPERYRQVAEIYRAALELEPEQRAAFLARSCGDDTTLRQEIERAATMDTAWMTPEPTMLARVGQQQAKAPED